MILGKIKTNNIRHIAWYLLTSTYELCDLRPVANLSVLPLLRCVILGKLPDPGVLPLLTFLILGKFPDLSFLPHLSCMILDKFANLIVLPLLCSMTLGTLPDIYLLPILSSLILGQLPHLSVLPYLFCIQVTSVSQSCLTCVTPGTAAGQASLSITNSQSCSNSCKSNQWCHPTYASSVVPLSSCLQSFSASGSFTLSQFIPAGGQKKGASALASVLPMNMQDWFSLGWSGWIAL